jgi:hypothetical protein
MDTNVSKEALLHQVHLAEVVYRNGKNYRTLVRQGAMRLTGGNAFNPAASFVVHLL